MISQRKTRIVEEMEMGMVMDTMKNEEGVVTNGWKKYRFMERT